MQRTGSCYTSKSSEFLNNPRFRVCVPAIRMHFYSSAFLQNIQTHHDHIAPGLVQTAQPLRCGAIDAGALASRIVRDMMPRLADVPVRTLEYCMGTFLYSLTETFFISSGEKRRRSMHVDRCIIDACYCRLPPPSLALSRLPCPPAAAHPPCLRASMAQLS